MKRTHLNDWLTLAATAVVAAVTGSVAGAIFAGEDGDFRKWISALSGWAAAVAAIVIGILTLAPLVRQVEMQMEAQKREAKTRLLAFKKESENWSYTVYIILHDLRRSEAAGHWNSLAPEAREVFPSLFQNPTREIVHEYYTTHHKNISEIVDKISEYRIHAFISEEFDEDLEVILRSLKIIQDRLRMICGTSAPDGPMLPHASYADEEEYWRRIISHWSKESDYLPPRTVRRSDLCERINQLDILIDAEIARHR